MSTSARDEVSEEATAPDERDAAESSAQDAGTGVASEGDDAGELDIEVEADGADGEVEEVAELDPMEALKAQLEEIEKAKQEVYDRLLRTTADLDNFRKRSKRDISDARTDASSRVLREMLPVVDNLERAFAHAEDNDNEAVKSIVEGLNLVLRQFTQAFERCGVKGLEAVGLPFDPALHEAVSQAPSEEHPPGTVIEVLQKGYTIGERLLRPALAVVSIAMPAAASDDASSTSSEEEAAAEPSESGEDDGKAEG